MMKLFAVWTGLEPATPCVTGRYSNQLNYQTKIQICRSRITQQRELQNLLLIQAVANIHRIFIFTNKKTKNNRLKQTSAEPPKRL